MGWALFGVTLVVAVILFFNLRSRARDDVARLEESRRRALQEAEQDAAARLDRLEREAAKSRLGERDALIRELLPALDSLHMAHDKLTDPDVQKGLDLVLHEFRRALERHGVTEINPEEGDPFDPKEHEAVESVEGEPADAENGTVARCHRIGYRSGDKVLRPAMVGVFKVLAPEPDKADEEDEEVVLDVGEDVPEVEEVPAG